MTRTLLYGGSFDPPHIAHVELPKAAMEFLHFDQVLYVPAFQSPLKQNSPSAEKHRVAMLELALANCPWASISTLELNRAGTSYTIDTIEALLNSFDELRLLVGADQWKQFEKWHRWEDIVKLANPVVIPREGFASVDDRVLPIDTLQSTSTDIRNLVHQGSSLDGVVHPLVAKYIAQHGLYQ